MKITIIGAAGTVGSCTAFTIVTQGLAEELVMLDVNEDQLMCYVRDLVTATSGLHDIVVRAGNDDDLPGSNIVIVAAGTRRQPSLTELLHNNVPIIRNIARKIERFCPDAVVITVTNPVDTLNYVMHLSSNLDRKKLIGYSLNDSIRFRMMVARALGVKATQIEGMVIGEHGDNQVLLFSSIRVNGQPMSVSEDFKQSIQKQLPSRFGASRGRGHGAGWTSAIGLAFMVSAITQDTKRVMPCSAILDEEYGCQGLSMGVPVILGREGIKQILEWKLAPDEQKELEHSINVLRATAQSVEKS